MKIPRLHPKLLKIPKYDIASLGEKGKLLFIPTDLTIETIKKIIEETLKIERNSRQ